MHTVRAGLYTFDFCGFLCVAYTTLNKLFAVFYILHLLLLLRDTSTEHGDATVSRLRLRL